MGSAHRPREALGEVIERLGRGRRLFELLLHLQMDIRGTRHGDMTSSCMLTPGVTMPASVWGRNQMMKADGASPELTASLKLTNQVALTLVWRSKRQRASFTCVAFGLSGHHEAVVRGALHMHHTARAACHEYLCNAPFEGAGDGSELLRPSHCEC